MKKGAVLVILSAVFYGLMPLFARISYAAGSTPFNTAALRFWFGSLICLIIIKVGKMAFPSMTKKRFLHFFVLSLLYASMPVLIYTSYTMIDAGMATTLHFTYPVIVMLLMRFFFRTKITPRQILCAVMSLSGVLLLSLGGGGQSLGIVLALISGVSYSVYIIYLSKSGLRELPVFVISFWITFLAGIEVTILAVCTGDFNLRLPVSGWLSCAMLGLLASALGIALFQQGMFLCGEVMASLLSTFEPLTGVLVGVLIYHEELTVRVIGGIALILLAVVLLAGRRKAGEQA